MNWRQMALSNVRLSALSKLGDLPLVNMHLVHKSALIVLIALGLNVTPAIADGPGWTANSTIVKLVTTGDGGLNVMLSPALNNCVSNGGYGQHFASVYPSHPGIKSMQASLLTAYLTGQPVALYLSDSQCTVLEGVLGGW